MPKIAEFSGIVIAMYFRDHPPPHFHAYVGDDVALIAIDTLEVIEGEIPRAKLRLVRAWAKEQGALLAERWAALEQKRK